MRNKKIISIILILIIVTTLFIDKVTVISAGVAHYEDAGIPYEYYNEHDAANKNYYNYLASPAALNNELPKLPGGSYVPPKNSGGHPLNYRMWIQKGLVVYGTEKTIPQIQGNTFHCGYEVHNPGDAHPTPYYGDGYFSVNLTDYQCTEHGKNCPTKSGNRVRGEWRYIGYDVNNNRFENINYIMEHYTPFYGRVWIKEPWSTTNRSKTGLKEGISVYNEAVYRANPYSPDVNKWISETLKGWMPEGSPYEYAVPYVERWEDSFDASKTKFDNEVYKYLYIKSAPTIMRPGQGTMWHERPNKVYPKSLTVPVLKEKKHLDVDCIITTQEYGDVLETELDKDTELYINVKGILHDEEVFTGSEDDKRIKQTVYYHRGDIQYWNFKLTLLSKDYTQISPTNSTNTQNVEFSSIKVKWRQLSDGFYIMAESQPVYINGETGKIGRTSVFIKAGTKPVPQEEKEIIIKIPTIEINHNIPEIAFDNIPFTGVYDNTDMSVVQSVSVSVGGQPVDYNYFFSGNYKFPRTSTPNGYMTYVEVTYILDKNQILLSGIGEAAKKQIEDLAVLVYKSVDIVYVYPTKPYAHFVLTSNTWKENRIINLVNDSTSVNIPVVMQHYPITEYRWYYGGDTTKLYKGTDTDLQKQLQYSKPGLYSITLEAKNTLGQWSDPFTYEFYVLEDYGPAIEVNLTDSVITRGDEISAWHYNIVSTDGDRIASARIELWYDSNGDNIVDTKIKEWNGLGSNGICEKEDFPVYKPDKLGYYVYKIYAKEEFVGVPGQDTLSQYINDSHKKTSTYEYEWWVDNYQPVADIYINAPIERSKVDLYIMLDKNLNDTKRNTIINERVNLENKLLGKNIIPNINIWDMKTYTYSQSASTTRNTGTTYPPSSITYESGGYSGTLNRTSVSDNGSYKDYGRYVTKTETTTYSTTWVNYCRTVFDRATGSQISNYESNPGAPSSMYITSNGYSGYIYRGTTVKDGPYETVTDTTVTIENTYTVYYSGTLSKEVQVWEPDVRWVSDYTGYYSGTIYKNVRQPYTDPYSGGDTIKYILYITDNTVSELTDLTMAKSKADSKLILAGQNNAKTQITHDYFINVQNMPITEVIEKAFDYIYQTCPGIEQIYILPGQVFNLNFAHYDIEGDSIIESQLQYVHDQNYYDNPTGKEPGTQDVFNQNGWTTTVKNKFMNVGKYSIYHRVKDRPAGNLGDIYSYYSGATELNVYVHRKPIADAVLDWRYNSTTGQCETIWVDKSYDLDHTTLPNKGIVERKIMFRRNGGEWLYYIPSTLTYGTYEVKYYVKDIEGVWSEPWTKTFTLDSSPQFSASARAKDPSFSLNSIPATETIELYNIWTRQPGPVRLEFSMPKTAGSSGGDLSKANVTFTSGVTGSQNGQDINWINQDVVIPNTFKDGVTTLTITARDTNSGAATSIPFTINVFTPINLTSDINNKTFISNQPLQIMATTTKYSNTTTVQMQYGTAYQSSVLTMTGALSGQQKAWTTTYTIPTNIPEGQYNARFVSTTPSGKQEVKLIPYRVTHNRPPTVTITGTNPSYIYEGDNLAVNFTVNDPDLQTLTYEIRISPGIMTSWTGTINPSGGVYPSMSVPTVNKIGVGNYTITVTVRDTYGATATATRNITVNPLNITATVSHTTEWELNRQKYNNAAISAGREIRNPDVYFPGEKFILQANTTAINSQSSVTATSVTAKINNTSYSTTLKKESSNIFTGYIWDPEMIHWSDRDLDFIFTVTYSNGTVKTNTVRVMIKDDEYYRLRLEF